jgi:hypothetical protein
MTTPIVPTTIDKVLADAELALSILASLGGVINPAAAGIAALLDKVLAVAQKAVSTHEAIAGTPLDLAQLHHVDPIP